MQGIDPQPGGIALRTGAVELLISLEPLSLSIRRAGHVLIDRLSPWAAEGTAEDRFIHYTEGVIPQERLEPRERPDRASAVNGPASGALLQGALRGGRRFRLAAHVAAEHVTLTFDTDGAPLRIGAGWALHAGEAFTGVGVRHGTSVDQAGRLIRLGADRRYTGPDCPPDLLEAGGIPQGDCAPVPWVISSSGWALWIETSGDGVELDLGASSEVSASIRSAAGPLRLHFLTDPTPASRLRRYCALTGYPELLPEWAYGHWKSRDVYEHERDVVDDFEGYRAHELPLDAIVIDSPWETQYNTWEFNPRQFPDAPGLIRRMRDDGVRTVVWVTPWVNLESADGQYPPDEESERLHREPAPNYAPAAEAGHFVRGADGHPYVARWWMGTGSPVDFTSEAAEAWWRGLARSVLELGVEGIKADDGEGYYLPPDTRFGDGRTGAEAAWAWGGLYRESMRRALREAHGDEGVLFGRSGWAGQQRHGLLWGGDQASDFWSLRALVNATLAAAASGFSNWSHDVGGYLGERLVERCPKELLIRWLQFGCFTPLMHAHGRFQQEAWTYDRETLDIYRSFLLLHERLVPYVRAAAATAARSGLPIVRPLFLLDRGDRRGFAISDSYGYGPALWVAPVLEDGARRRRVELPRGDWIDYWTHERLRGGCEVTAAAPLDRIPVFVRSGSVVVTYPEAHVARGLGDTPESERPLEAKLWGEPSLGSAGARLADGTRVRWRRDEWSVTPERDVTFTEI